MVRGGINGASTASTAWSVCPACAAWSHAVLAAQAPSPAPRGRAAKETELTLTLVSLLTLTLTTLTRTLFSFYIVFHMTCNMHYISISISHQCISISISAVHQRDDDVVSGFRRWHHRLRGRESRRRG